MTNRILNQNGAPSSDPDEQLTLQQRLDICNKDWKFKRKDEAFVGLLNAVAFMSHGIAVMNQLTERLERDNKIIAKELHEAKERIAALEERTNDQP